MGGFAQKTYEIDAQLEHMRQAFLTRLAEKGLHMHEHLIRISRHGPSPELRGAIARNAHQTAGVAASFGYGELGALARLVETAWTEEFSLENLDLANAVTEDYLDAVEATLDA